MKIFGQIIRTAVNVTTLPVDVVKDALMSLSDAAEGEDIGHRTIEKLQQIKDEADED